MSSRCSMCGTADLNRKNKFCSVCTKIMKSKMNANGYLQQVPHRMSPGIFRDSRGRTERNPKVIYGTPYDIDDVVESDE